MSDYPFFLDIPIALLVMLAMELLILGRNYRVFSPMTLFLGAFGMLYVGPYLGHMYWEPIYRLSLLKTEQFSLAFWTLRKFFYTFYAISLVLLFRQRRKIALPILPVPEQVQWRTKLIFFLFLAFMIISLGAGVGFNPLTMIDRALNPRAYTYIKEGLGPINYLRNIFRGLILIFAAIMVFSENKSKKSILFFCLVAGLTILGAGKTAVVMPLIVLLVVWQMLKWSSAGFFKKMWHLALTAAAAFAVVIFAFMLLGRVGERDTFAGATSHLYKYQKEGYYLPLVIENFRWSPRRLPEAAYDSVIVIIPRAVWPGKPMVGLYSRYFKPAFDRETVSYHVSTFGCLAEAHMLFGPLGPWLYGVIWALLVYKVYGWMIRPTTWLKAFLVVTMAAWSYLLMRTGFTGTNFGVLVVVVVGGYVCTRGLDNLAPELVQAEIDAQRRDLWSPGA
ncbi:MAG: hypothetical protein BIFFINMI_00843 [Phycisphaerae bacterium]|nr:hypothetical protein [Phycisphaerae bacterium]